MSAHTVVGRRAVPGSPPADVPSYVTSRDAAALLGVPEPEFRQLIRDGIVAGFRAGGYWIADGAAVARYGASAEGALARLRTDYPGWRIGPLTSTAAAFRTVSWAKVRGAADVILLRDGRA